MLQINRSFNNDAAFANKRCSVYETTEQRLQTNRGAFPGKK
jgi:hypothetical protein